MKKILHVISSPRGGSTVKESNLIEKQYPHLDEAQITSFFTPEQYRTPENIIAVRHSDESIREIMEADTIVIGAPFYNFSIHSTLKAWIDHIVRVGVTFNMNEKGYEGLVSGKKVYIAIASGGIYSEGVMQPYDFAGPYLKAILGFIGITDVNIIRVEGTAIPGIKDSALGKAIDSIVL